MGFIVDAVRIQCGFQCGFSVDSSGIHCGFSQDSVWIQCGFSLDSSGFSADSASVITPLSLSRCVSASDTKVPRSKGARSGGKEKRPPVVELEVRPETLPEQSPPLKGSTPFPLSPPLRPSLSSLPLLACD